MKIILAFPDFSLSPNRKNGKHWTSTSKSKESRYQSAFYTTKQAMKNYTMPKIPHELNITFIEPDKRRRDLDNMLSSLKQDIDAICKALGIDDRVFDTVVLKRSYSKNDGLTIIEII